MQRSRAAHRLGLACALALLSACDPHLVQAVDIPLSGSSGAGGSSGASGGGSGGAAGRMCDDPDRDRDGDLVPDCDDQCPDQPLKSEPGVCGCELPDEDSGDLVGCQNLIDALRHRYSFNGSGSVVVDSVSGRDGVLSEGTAELDGSGVVTLGGARSGEYVDLPNGLISELTSVTLEAWVRWSGGAGWQRIFDFGDDGSGFEDSRDAGANATYLFLTPKLPDEAPESPHGRVAYQRGMPVEARVDAMRAFPIGIDTHVAVTFDVTSKTLALYMNGLLESSVAFTAATDVDIRLGALNDVNCWLGRSQYVADADFAGLITEFRIYSEALSAEQIWTSQVAGPDAAYLP